MKIKLILLLFIASSNCLKSDAPYIQQNDRPIIAGHRGLSTLFPENTIESQYACMYQGADFIELDVVLSKEGILVVSHDAYLSRLTNVQEFPQFQDRRKNRTFYDAELFDWWVSDFTVPELKQLTINQVLVPGRNTILDNIFTFPTMQEVLDAVRDFNVFHSGVRNPDGNLVGILLETKDHHYHINYTDTNIGLVLYEFLQQNNVSKIIDCQETVPLILMSFDSESVILFKTLSDLPRVQLVKETWFPFTVEQIALYATILGADINILWNQTTQTPKELVSQVQNSGLLLYGWAFRDEQNTTFDLFNTTRSQVINEDQWNNHRVLHIYEIRSPDIAQAYAQSYKRSELYINSNQIPLKDEQNILEMINIRTEKIYE